MYRRRPVFVISLLTLGIVSAAFTGVASAGERLTKKEYLKQGNAICKDATDELDAPTQELFADLELGEQPSPEAQTTYVATVTPVATRLLEDLGGLEGPSKLEKKVDNLINRYRAILDEVEADPSVFFDADDDPFVKPNKAFVKLGLKECG